MISSDVVLGRGVVIHQPDLVNLYGCSIGDHTKVGAFVEVQRGASIGANCKVSSHSFICDGVVIEDGVFIGHGVMFINDVYPRAVNDDGSLQTGTDWKVIPTRIRRGASLGSNCTILAGITVGEGSLVGAGAVVTRDVPDYAVVAGVPARVVGDIRERQRAAAAIA
jgi:acetyltransferase-like isoleucine patch superfamily enzyme